MSGSPDLSAAHTGCKANQWLRHNKELNGNNHPPTHTHQAGPLALPEQSLGRLALCVWLSTVYQPVTVTAQLHTAALPVRMQTVISDITRRPRITRFSEPNNDRPLNEEVQGSPNCWGPPYPLPAHIPSTLSFFLHLFPEPGLSQTYYGM